MSGLAHGGGKQCELATYDIKRDAVSYYVQARKYEQAIAKLFKNRHLVNGVLIVDVTSIEPDR